VDRNVIVDFTILRGVETNFSSTNDEEFVNKISES